MTDILNSIEGFQIVTVSPLQNPLKSLFALVMVIFFTEATLRVFRHLSKGMTLIGKKPLPIPIDIQLGNVDIKKNGLVSVYKNPPATAFIGMTLYFVVHFMIFVAFKAIEFQFKY